MLIVIADDFTGAAEMGGIGYRYGLSTEVQLQPDLSSTADLIVIDADTRSMSEADAVRKTKELADILKKSGKKLTLFKKVDSVMRGYIAIESRIIQQELGYKRVLLLPANPLRGRKIMSGSYYLDGITLDQTIFSADPDFPIGSALVEKVIKPDTAGFTHQHISYKDKLPATSFITGDVETKNDIQHYVEQLNDDDLCAGAAECFEVFLEKLGNKPVNVKAKEENHFPYTLIINGSTVKRPGEKGLFTKAGIPYSSIPDVKEESDWQKSILQQLKEHFAIVVAIDDPLNRDNNRPTIYLDRYVKLVHFIISEIGMEKIHFGLTGGATASAIIRSMGIKRLEVKKEVIPGVVTLQGEKGLFTVKPGSYEWPASFFDDLSKR
jgi:D-threonate/D-erythronate kinase